LVSFAGTALVAGAVWEATFVVPSLAQEAPRLLDEGPVGRLALGFVLSYTLAGVGGILFGVATLRARVYARTPTVLLIIGVVPIVVGSFLSLAPGRRGLGVAVVWLGLASSGGGAKKPSSPRV
jgi:hypothetical protein